jgi:hypothetical protein
MISGNGKYKVVGRGGELHILGTLKAPKGRVCSYN